MNNCSPSCQVCNHPKIDAINLSVRAGVGHNEIVQQFGGFALRTLESHIQNQSGQMSYRQVGAVLKDAQADIKPLSKLSSNEAKLALTLKLLDGIERVQNIALITQSLKAEQQLGELILKASNLLSTLDYNALSD